LGAACASGELITHLDDDNEYLPGHVSALVSTLESSPELSLAFSWRRLLYEDGTPFQANAYPWVKQPNLANARYIFDELVRFGVFQRDSCEMHDQHLGPGGERLFTVDVSEWMIRREFHLQHPFREHYAFREVSHGITEDYLYCLELADSGIAVGCSHAVTLNYYLGGRTTKWLQDAL
jgi:hypothetical protein